MVQLNFDLTGMTDEIVRAVKESLKANHDTTAGGIVITAKQIGEGVGEAIFQFIAGALETAVEELGNGLAEKLQNGGVPDIAAMREQILGNHRGLPKGRIPR